MHPKTRTKLIAFLLVSIFMVFACGLGSDSSTPEPAPTTAPAEPTAVPPTTVPPEPTAVPPTEVPPEPTAAPEEPTAAPEEPTAAPEETEEPTTSEPIITIDMVNGSLNSFGSWRIVGLITNNTERAVDNVEIEVELFDVDGNSLYVDTTYADLYSLAPGETSPFSVSIFEDLPDADSFEATIVGNSTADLDRAEVEVRNMVISFDDSGDPHITGELVNNSDQPIEINGIAAATFDAEGEVVSADSYSVSIRYLAPGEDGPFRISPTGPESSVDVITDYTVYYDTEFTDPEEATGLTIGDAYNFLDYFGNLHLVGEITNDGSLTLNVRLIAAVYDADGNVIDAASDDLDISALAPGETLPYQFDFWGPMNYTDGMFSDVAESYTIQVDRYWTWESSYEMVDLSTADDVNTFDQYNGEFNGLIVNDSGGAVDGATIVVYLRDIETGQVVGTGYDFVFDEIADGDSVEYSVYVDTSDGFDITTAEYFIIVKGELP